MKQAGLISVREAMAIIDALPVLPRKVRLPLREAAGLRLADDLPADRDFPAFDKALMDGYAVRAGDVRSPPTSLRVVGESAAGAQPAASVGAMQALAIMTGAPLPRGADAVVPIEQTDLRDFAGVGQTIAILAAAAAGKNIAQRGSDARAGVVVLEKGTALTPARVAVAASVGAATIAVWDRPRCAVLATGNELVAVDQAPGAAELRNSNGPMLVSLLERLGCSAVDLGIAADRRDALEAAIRRGLEHDVLFVAGGMSMGHYDLVPPVLRELGADFKITQVRIRPGKPFVLAEIGGKYVVGLPGNPVSGFVCTVRLAARLLARIGGGTCDDRVMTLPLACAIPANGAREFYQPAAMEAGCARPLAWVGSADIFTLAKADGLLIRGENAPAADAGEMVGVIRLD